MNKGYLLKRAGQAVFTVVAVVTITFFLIRLLPGSPEAYLKAIQVGADTSSASQEYNASAYTQGGGNSPLWQQYIDYLGALAQGQFGNSIYFQRPVIDILAEGIPWTLFVVGTGVTLAYGIGIALGAYLAYYEGTRLDQAISSLATFMNSIPYYVAAVVLVYVLGYQLKWFPKSGRLPQGVDPGFTVEFFSGLLYHATLPVASIVITAFGFRALAMRGNSIQVLGEEYVRVARLRGLPDRRITLQYVGRNAVLPMYTGLMIAIGALLGGSIIIEEIFQYQGLGYFFFRGIIARDYPLMMGGFLVITIAVVIGLFIADLTYGFIDPRAGAGSETDTNSGSRVSFLESILAVGGKLRRLPRVIYRRTRGQDVASVKPAAPTRTDDGVEQSIFQTTSDVERTRKERYRRMFDQNVLAPLRIIWVDTRARIGAAIILFYVLMGTIGVWLYPEPSPNEGPVLLGAFWDLNYPLGTDALGRDVLGMVIYSTPDILLMMASGALFATAVSTAIGILAGYSRGQLDRILMQLSDIALTIPGLPLVMVLAVTFEPENPVLVGLLLTVNAWGGTARRIRSQVLTTGRESYVEASGIMSLPLRTILSKDILPNIAPFVFVQFVQLARRVILSAVALYFLGVLPFTSQNWGIMMNQAYNNGALLSFGTAHWLLAPMLAIVVLTYGLILFAQGTDRIFNPRVRARHAKTAQTDVDDEDQSGPSGPVPGDD